MVKRPLLSLMLCNLRICLVVWALLLPSTESRVYALPQEDNAIHIPDGTEVRLLVQASIYGKTAKPNDPVPLQVLHDVKVGDLVLIAKKAPAIATVAEIQQPRHMMRAGTMFLKVDHVTLVTGQTQKLRGSTWAKGSPVDVSCSPNDSFCMGAIVFALPFLPLVHGHEAILRKGTVFTAVLDGEAILDRADVIAHQPAAPQKKEDPASVTFYSSPNGPGGSRVACGRVNLGRVFRGQNFTIRLPAGNYWFSLSDLSDKKNVISLDVEPGEEYYLSVSFVPYGTSAGGRNHLWLMEHDIGEVESSETTPLDPHKVLDIASANAEELKANPNAKNKK